MLKANFINDFKEPRRQARKIVSGNLEGRGEFSFSYIALLLSATVVCTLGLITNSTAVIIGGMIIAPLMWPLLKVSFGIVIKRTRISYKPFIILIISTLVILLGSAAVALLSPYKQVTSEILTRTAPTSLEIFIALAAAVIAALSVTHPKISESVAGVAVATSLVPPLCVSGIGLAYLNYEILWGGFLLYLTNAVTIMIVSIIVFSLFLFGRDFSSLKSKHLFSLFLILLIISLPLYIQLERSIAGTSVTSSSKTIIEGQIAEYAPNSKIQDYSALLIEDGNKVSIKATILLPPSRNITFEQQQILLDLLESGLGKEIDLQLILQESLEPITEEEIAESNERVALERTLREELGNIDSSLQLNSVSTTLDELGGWDIVASVRASDSEVLELNDITAIEALLAKQTGRSVGLSLELIQSKLLNSEQSEFEENEEKIRRIINKQINNSKILSLSVNNLENSETIEIDTVVIVEDSYEASPEQKSDIKKAIESSLDEFIQLSLRVIKFQELD